MNYQKSVKVPCLCILRGLTLRCEDPQQEDGRYFPGEIHGCICAWRCFLLGQTNKQKMMQNNEALVSAPKRPRSLKTRATFSFALRGEVGARFADARTTSARPASLPPPPSHSHSQEPQWLDSHWLREDKFENNEIIADKVPGASGFVSKDVRCGFVYKESSSTHMHHNKNSYFQCWAVNGLLSHLIDFGGITILSSLKH